MPMILHFGWVLPACILSVLFATLYFCGIAAKVFSAALIVAYLLNPGVVWLKRYHMPRTISSLVMILGLTFSILCFFTVLVPIIYQQGLLIGAKLAAYDYHHSILQPLASHLESISPDIAPKLQKTWEEMLHIMLASSGEMLERIANSGNAFFNFLVLALLMPVIIFYLLKDWTSVVTETEQLLPKRCREHIASLMQSVDRTMSGYLHGQSLVCLIMAAYYCLALSLLKVESPLLLGVCSGLMHAIPFVGVLLMATISSLMSLLQYGGGHHIMLVLLVYALGSGVESSFLTPKIIRKHVGVHPAWLLFGLMAAPHILGFWGIFIAVPLTAVLSTIITFYVDLYRTTKFYQED